MEKVELYPETSAFFSEIRKVNEVAFGDSRVAQVIEDLRKAKKIDCSLVACVDGEVVGHILFSPVILLPDAGSCRATGLAPLVVHPKFQKQGIGTLLTQRGLSICKAKGFDLVVVLGHTTYYPRFGFVPASRHGLESEYKAGDGFMALVFNENAVTNWSGIVKYQPEFKANDC